MSIEAREAVLSAYQQTAENEETNNDNKSSETKVDEKKEETSESAGENEDDSNEDEDEEAEAVTETEEQKKERTERALQILSILEDPKASKNFVRALATSLEDVKEEQGTKEGAKAAKNIIEELAEELGEENKFMLEPLVKAFTKLFGEREKVLVNAIKGIQNEILTERMNNEYELFVERNKITDDEQTLMKKYAEKVKPDDKTSFKEHLKTLLTLARAEATKTARTQKQSDKVVQNKQEATQNKVGKSGGGNEPSKLKEAQQNVRTTKDAVALALKQISGEFED